MPRPNFLVIGAQKAATTWLARALAPHPDVYTADTKELHYYDLRENYLRGFDWYLAHFDAAEGEKAIGESTPNYLWVTHAVAPELAASGLDPDRFGAAAYPEVNEDIPALVKRDLPDAKLVVILRDPVERTISAFYHQIRRRRIPPWSRILDVGHRFGIVSMSFYDMQLERWFECYDPERFLILGFEDEVIPEPEATVAKVYRHLGVDDGFDPPGLRDKQNERSSGPYLYASYAAPKVAGTLFRMAPKLHDVTRPNVVVTAEDRERLHELFAPGVERLQKLVGREFPRWR
jgi:Sulfotransferase family